MYITAVFQKKVLKEEVLSHKLINNDVRRKKIKATMGFHISPYKQPVLLMENGTKGRGMQCFVSVGTKRTRYKDAKKTARPRLIFLQILPDTKSLKIIREVKFSVPLEQGTMCCITHGKSFVFVYGCSSKGYVFLRYSITLGTWLKLEAPPSHVKCAMMVSSTRTIYFMGGIDGSSRRVDSGFEYSIEGNTWKSIPRMPAKLSSGGICVHSTSNVVYIAGGYSGWAITQSKVNSVYAYNIQTMTWYIEAPMHHKRSGLILVEINARLYAIGGLNGEKVETNEIAEEYNIVLNQWTIVTLHCHSLPHLRFPCRVKVMVVDGVVVISGIKRTCDCSNYEYLIEMDPEKQFKLRRVITMDPDFSWNVFGYVQVPL